MARRKVLYLCHTLAVGGAENLILSSVRHLPRERYEVGVGCIVSEGPLAAEVRDAGSAVTCLGRVPGWRDPLAVAALVRYLRSEQPDVVHTFLLTANLYGRLAAILAGVPVIVASEVNMYRWKARRHALAERLLARRTNCIVASARVVKDYYVAQVGVSPARVQVIYNGVDSVQTPTVTDREGIRLGLGLPPDEVVWAVVARFTEQKGLPYLIEALAAMPPASRPWLLLVGDGPQRQLLERQVQVAALTDRVRFVGIRRNLDDIFLSVDGFVLPSLWEGLPIALLHAMAAGLSVIATAVGGNGEVVVHGETGWLVPPADTRALREALERLTGDAELRSRLGKNARKTILSRFSIARYIEEIDRLYTRLLAEPQAA